MTDGDESDVDIKTEMEIESKPTVPKEPEIIGHLEESGELVVVVKGKGRGRPKGTVTLFHNSNLDQCFIFAFIVISR